jgi:predicted AlkP superfamily phosphohydrolase/phosphomutase
VADWWLDAEQGIDLDTYLEQVERLDRYIDGMVEYAFAHEDFRLMLSYHPAVDEYMHSSHLVDPGQWAYSPGRALAAAEGLKRVARSVDRSVGNMWRALDPDEDALVVVSDHGMVPLHHTVRVNRVLAEAGLLEVDASGRRPQPAASSQVVAASAAACSHLYLNLEGREPGGVVPRRLQIEVLHRAARALADLEVDGEPVVERIINRQEAPDFGLDHRNSGDLIVFFAPGFSARDSLDGDTVELSRTYAQHGYLNHHAALHGVLFARGAGIEPRHPKQVQSTEVASFVAHWMGLRFPSAR